MSFESPFSTKYTSAELDRFHSAAKSIEYDGIEAIVSCSKKYGRDVAGALLIAFLRRSFGSMEHYQTPDWVVKKVNDFLPDWVVEKVNDFLKEKGLA